MIDFCATTNVTDIPHLIAQSREAHEESRFLYIPFSEAKAEKIIRRAFGDDRRHAFLLVLEKIFNTSKRRRQTADHNELYLGIFI